MSRHSQPDDVPDPQVHAEAAPPNKLTLRQHAVAFLKELSVVVLGALVVASLLRGFVGQMFIIPSSSMENTLQIGDRVAVEKLSSVKRGQTVVFADPGGWLDSSAAVERGPLGRFGEFIGVLPDTGTNHLIKRVVGLPGDEVVCCDAEGRVTVNDQPLDEAGYLYAAPDGTRTAPSDLKFTVLVPQGRIFVMGDHRDNSRDSRCHLNDLQPGAVKGENAFVAEELVVGRAFAVVWPFADAQWLETPATFESVPPGKPDPPAKPVVDAGPEASC